MFTVSEINMQQNYSVDIYVEKTTTPAFLKKKIPKNYIHDYDNIYSQNVM